MTIETSEEIEGLLRIGHVVAVVRDTLLEVARPGMTTAELDAIGAKLLEEHGAQSAPKHLYQFPGYTCISINEEVAHGIPGERVILEGDMLNVDVSASMGGFFADTGASRVMGDAARFPAQHKLCSAGQEALEAALSVVRAGVQFRVMGRAIEEVARGRGFRIIRNLCSHGVGRALHEQPDYIPSYDDRADIRRFKEGDVITIEPFLTTGRTQVHEGADGWTMLNAPGSITAQYEHSLIITRERPILLTVQQR
jgi:methionyl aminopeptidase